MAQLQQLPSLLANVNIQELKSVKIAIRRSNVPPMSRLLPLRRRLDDPRKLKVHINGKYDRRVFDRDDILVNCYEPEEVIGGTKSVPEKPPDKSANSQGTIFTDFEPKPPPFALPPEEDSGVYYRSKERYDDDSAGTSKGFRRSRSKGRSRKSPSPYRTRTRSPKSYNYPSTATSSKREQHRSRSREYHRSRSKSPARFNKKHENRDYKSRERPSRSPEYKTTTRRREDDYRRSPPPPARKNEGDKYRKSKSPARKTTRRSPPPAKYHEDRDRSRRHSPRSPPRKRSRTPLKPGEYRPNHRRTKSRSRSPRPGEYRTRKRSPSPRLRPGEYRPPKYPNQKHYDEPSPSAYGYYEGMEYAHHHPPHAMLPRFMAPPRAMFPPGIIMPPYQLVAVPNIPPMRPFLRPPKIYNNRTIPRLVSPPRPAATSTTTSDNGPNSTVTSDENNQNKNGDK